MQQVLDELKKGNEEIAGFFKVADAKWAELMKEGDALPVASLAERISVAQMWFEKNCGGRWLGQEIMAWSAFAHLYSAEAGFDDNAKQAVKLAQAFDRTSCSIEVKGYARKAAKSYDVDDYA